MTKKKKIFFKFIRNPNSLKYKEIETLLLSEGFKKIQGKGSHLKFAHPKIKKKIILPIHTNECKKEYKKKIAQFIVKYFILILWNHFITQLHLIIKGINIQ